MFLSGDLDHHSAAQIRGQIDDEIQSDKTEELFLDFAEVGFMDSSGIGLVLGRYKLMARGGGRVVIENPPPSIKKVMRLAGLATLVGIRESNFAGKEQVK